MSSRTIKKSIAYWLLPEGIRHALSRTRKALAGGSLPDETGPSTTPEVKAILDRNAELKNRHQGQRCFIIATGPSIKQQDLTLLKDELCISVSNFFVHPDYSLIRPRYHCMAPYHPPITEEAWSDWMREAEAKTGDATLIFGLSDLKRNLKDGLFSKRHVHFLNFEGDWNIIDRAGIDLTCRLPPPQSVTIMACLAAVYMGVRDIYLLGCDHDWIIHLHESRHFYDETKHSLNRHGYNEWFAQDFSSYCADYVRLWDSYKALNRIAKKQSVRIVNATRGGVLDVFPRVRYADVIS